LNIFVTNDDGAESPGILLLAEMLRSLGHRAIIVAPDRNRSGFSQAITMGGDLDIKELDKDVWICKGTPADCVFVMMKGAFDVKPDMVFSGINAGSNLGTDLLYSATAGAARQAALYCEKSIALSLEWTEQPYLWDESVAWVKENFDMLLGFCKRETYLNVNMPNVKGMHFDGKFTLPAHRHYYDRVELKREFPGAPPLKGGDGWVCCKMILGKIETEPNERSDYNAVKNGRVSISRIFVYPVGEEK
jgi:5'-nucleotidase